MEQISETLTTLGSFLENGGKKPADRQGIEIPFHDILRMAIQDVNVLQKEAEQKTRAVVSGEANSFHEAIIATEKATLSLQLLVQFQNKLIDAYHEITRLQI